MSYIVADQVKDAKTGTVISESFFAGYERLPNNATNGFKWTDDIQEAFRFESREQADNWYCGEQWRAGGCVVREDKE